MPWKDSWGVVTGFLSWNLAGTLVARAIRNVIRANRFVRIIRNWNPYFYSASGRFARITRIPDSPESSDSRESCESIRAIHATKAGTLWRHPDAFEKCSLTKRSSPPTPHQAQGVSEKKLASVPCLCRTRPESWYVFRKTGFVADMSFVFGQLLVCCTICLFPPFWACNAAIFLSKSGRLVWNGKHWPENRKWSTVQNGENMAQNRKWP